MPVLTRSLSRLEALHRCVHAQAELRITPSVRTSGNVCTPPAVRLLVCAVAHSPARTLSALPVNNVACAMFVCLGPVVADQNEVGNDGAIAIGELIRETAVPGAERSWVAEVHLSHNSVRQALSRCRHAHARVSTQRRTRRRARAVRDGTGPAGRTRASGSVRMGAVHCSTAYCALSDSTRARTRTYPPTVAARIERYSLCARSEGHAACMRCAPSTIRPCELALPVSHKICRTMYNVPRSHAHCGPVR